MTTADIITAADELTDKIVSALQDDVRAKQWYDEIVEILAKAECKRRKEIPSWAKLNKAQRSFCLEVAKTTLATIDGFFESRIAALVAKP